MTPEQQDANDLRDVLIRNGFRRCDIAACNCDSWHHVGGFAARFREIEEAIGDHNGKTLIQAVQEKLAQLARLRAILEPLRELEAAAAQAPWKATNSFDGSDWLMCSVGTAYDMRKWDVTTDGVRASELRGGAEEDATLIAAARNALPALLQEIQETP